MNAKQVKSVVTKTLTTLGIVGAGVGLVYGVIRSINNGDEQESLAICGQANSLVITYVDQGHRYGVCKHGDVMSIVKNY